jgi:hypothetical protein
MSKEEKVHRMKTIANVKIALFLTLTVSFLSCSSHSKHDFRIETCPSISGGDYAPDKTLYAANILIKMGESDAYMILKSEAKKKIGGGIISVDTQIRDERIAILCTLLYRTESPKPLRPPMFGGPDMPYWSMKHVDWPCFPLAISDGVPFLLVSGYDLGGVPESGSAYLKYCKKNGTFRTKAYKIPPRQKAEKALEKLFSSTRWKKIKWKDAGQGWSYEMDEEWAKARISKQIDRMVEPKK